MSKSTSIPAPLMGEARGGDVITNEAKESPLSSLLVEKSQGEGVRETTRVQVQETYGKLPFYFIQNDGQVDEKVKYYEKGSGHATYFTKEGVYISLINHKNETKQSNISSPDISIPPFNKVGQRGTTSEFIKLTFLDANPNPEIVAEGVQEGKVNYFIGNDPKKWGTNIPTCKAVLYKEAYPGIDIKFYGNNRQLEYDIIVNPGADPSTVKLAYEGIESLKITEQGDLEISLKEGKIIQKRPIIYQELEGKRVAVDGQFRVAENVVIASDAKQSSAPDTEASFPSYRDDNKSHLSKNLQFIYSFKVASYDKKIPLIIDPVLVYSTYLGGSLQDRPESFSVDAYGNAYIAGITESIDFPTANPIQPTYGGGSLDVFVVKLDASGALIYSTYLGGGGNDPEGGVTWAEISLAVDQTGNAFVAGSTNSNDFPTTLNAAQTVFGGSNDAFVTKLSASGGLVYSTYVGGSSGDVLRGNSNWYNQFLAVDSIGNAIITGVTTSGDFPTVNAIYPVYPGGQSVFVTKLDPFGAFAYSTYLGVGYAENIATDDAGNAYIIGYTFSNSFPTVNAVQPTNNGGRDVFITKLDSSGSFVYSTYLGGSAEDRSYGLAVDNGENAYVVGMTYSTDFPLANAAVQSTYGGGNYDGYVTKLSSSGAFVYSTYIGGTSYDIACSVATDSNGNAYVAGTTSSLDFPTISAFQPTHGGGGLDADFFIIKLESVGTVVYSTYLGGYSEEYDIFLAVDTIGSIYAAGRTTSSDFPVTTNAVQTLFSGLQDSFVTQIDAFGELIYSTFLGGSSYDAGKAIALDSAGNIFVSGYTQSTDFPTSNAIQAFYGGVRDVFVYKLSSSSSLFRTGQTTCYDSAGTVIPCAGTGQDGEIRAGVPWPSPRFTDNSDNTITDNLTGMMWTKNANPSLSIMTWQQALDYVAGMNSGIYPNFGHTDWRLPNIIELLSLTDAEHSDPPLPTGHPFTNLSNVSYWSSTSVTIGAPVPFGPSWAWKAGVGSGGGDPFVGQKMSSEAYAWPVRSGNAGEIELQRTGQTTCYNSSGNVVLCTGTGQDGEIQTGVPWPNPRFIDHSDGTITDQLTGLMWTKNANPPGSTQTWQAALDYVAEMNAGINPNFGHTDWRLPNSTEIRSIVDYSSSSPALPSSHPFLNVVNFYYWSSTTYAAGSGFTSSVTMDIGDLSPYTKTGSIYIWPVRGGILVTPAVEVCDGIDNDGDGQIDEGLTITYYEDVDGDAYGNMSVSIQACTQPVGFVSNDLDCNDNNAFINPGATEVCNLVDDNCNSQIDEGVQNIYYQDADNDTYGNMFVYTQACTQPAGYVSNGADCDDGNASINPGVTEGCNDVDDNCNAQIDEGVQNTYYQDTDNDTYGNASVTMQACTPPVGYVTNSADCNDSNASINPIASEVCNTVDDNCNSQIDEAVQNTYYQDADNDTYGNAAVTTQACTQLSGYVSNSSDCNDGNTSINPGATEVCNGVDDNCNAQIDEEVQNTYYLDADNDTYGNASVTTQACTQPSGYVSNSSDCNDDDASVNPGATEICNGVDDNCSGQIDEGVTNTYYEDSDGDTYGNVFVTTQACTQPVGDVLDSSDCDDSNASINPGATEVCNLVDDNCNGQTDEGVQNTYYRDADNDAYGNALVTTQACVQPLGYVSDNTDCNDGNILVNPAAAEICNGIDDNCNAQIDEGVQNTYYQDADNDTYGNVSVTTQACTQPAGYVLDSSDCDDGSDSIYPGATEICNSIDDNCDSQIDESCTYPTELPRTGQTTCYASDGAVIACAGTGQDGEIRAGVPWPDPRFTDNGDGTVTDNLTGLVWTQDANAPGPAICSPATTKTWQEALDYVACLNTNSYLGYTDWRLPNSNELMSLVTKGQVNTSTWLITQGFNNVQSNFSYWSSTSLANNPGYAWVVVMLYDNMANCHKSNCNGIFVWPVRSGQIGLFGSSVIQLPRTGQTACYDSAGAVISCAETGQDGEIQAGVPWPDPRFTDNGDGTVTDNLTGLMWTQNANAPGPAICSPATTKTWQEALDYVACLNINSYLGYTDWRLPNSNELMSLMNKGQVNTGTWLNTQGFNNNVQFGGYYSSTSYTHGPSYAWIVGMWDGMFFNYKSYNYYVWPVRSGHIVPLPLIHSITGIVNENSVGLSGVVMMLSGDASASTTTASNGTYSFTGLADGSYKITPRLSDYTFTPPSRLVTVAGRDVPGVDFSAINCSNQAEEACTFPSEIPLTGQTTCYDSAGTVIPCAGTGQDGEIQAGVPWPVPRFTDNGDGTVTDNLTGLMWTQDANLMATRDPSFDADGTAGDGSVIWQHALDYVAKLNNEGYLGYTDWRLPNVNELRSLINAGQGNSATWLNTKGFSNVRSDYWSSTSNAYSSVSAWYVFMQEDGHINYQGKSGGNYVWPVRSGQPGLFGSSVIQLPRTGQTTCYDSAGTVIPCAGTGQDGEIQAGVPWPDPRFTDNGDGTVTDNLTGLMWTKDGNAPGPGPYACSPATTKTWQEALDYVACLNTDSYLGYNDWRLPNVLELSSLFNAGQSNSSAWLNAQGFSNVQQSDYWSSTSGAYNPNGAWIVNMWYGYMGNHIKSFFNSYYHFYVWPVRGGQVAPIPSVHSIIGTVTENSVGLSGVTMTLSGDTSASTITASNGTYSFTGLADGSYTITPSLGGYKFTPSSRLVTVVSGDVTGVNFSATRSADLIVSIISSATTAIRPGGSISLSNTVKNQGKVSAGSFTIAFHLSTDAVYGGTDDRAFSTTRSVSSLGVGVSSSATTTLTIPSTTPLGNYYICAKADSGGTVTESNETNNTRCSTSTIKVTRPDLVMTAVTPGASSVNAGRTLSVTNTAKNQGGLSASSFTIAFRLSKNTTYGDSDDVSISATRSVSSLGAGASSTATTGLLIPSTTKAGNYYVCAKADSGSSVTESNENNNTLCSSTQVTVPKPDLIMTAISTTTTTIKPGSSLSLSNTVKNQGGSSAGSFTIAFHLSADAVYGGTDDRAFSTTRSVSSLGVGLTSSASTTVTVPSTIPLGTYYICSKADNGGTVSEGNETNNTRCTTSTINVTKPDLVMTAVTPGATTVNAGSTLSVTNTVKNQGGISASSFKIAFRLSKNTTYGDTDDVTISTTRSVGSLGAGASSTATTGLSIPSTTKAGNYYVCTKADSGSAIAESNENNNILCSSTQVTVPSPDLIVSALSTAATTVSRGGSFSLSNTAKNQGGSSAGSFAIAFHLSADAVYGGTDDRAFSTTRSVSSLGVGASNSASTGLTVPSTIPVGSYHVCAKSDSGNTVNEGINEGNNTRCTAAIINVL